MLHAEKRERVTLKSWEWPGYEATCIYSHSILGILFTVLCLLLRLSTSLSLSETTFPHVSIYSLLEVCMLI